MVNATNPTLNTISLLGGLIHIFVDQYASLKKLTRIFTTINGTSFNTIRDQRTSTNYSVPASTNLRLWGFESISIVQGTGMSLCQFGYSDDAAGTNFVSLFDVFLAFGTTSQTQNNVITGSMIVPTGKFTIMKTTGGIAADTVTITTIGLETN